MNFQMFKLDLEKAEEPENKLPTLVVFLKNQESCRKIYFCFNDNAKVFDWVDLKKKKLLKNLQAMVIPDHLACLLRNMYPGQEETVRTWYGTTDWFQIGKGV